ncbi:MAG: hypothetical protein ABIO62_15395 [Paracoccaceae bacterium]
MSRRGEAGVVLVTILVVMALCVAVIVAMTTQSENATRATGRNLDAGQARALIAAGEASAISALLQDMQTAPDADGPTEAWAKIAQSDTAILGGHFQLAIRDEAARFNLNTLTKGSLASRQNLLSVVQAAGLPPEVAARIAASLKGGKLLLAIQDLAVRAGLSDAELAVLEGLVTATADLNSGVNINTAPEALLLALLHNPDTADRIVTRRKTDLITPAVLNDMGIILPAGLTLTSGVFSVAIRASSGEASVTVDAIIHRWRDKAGRVYATVTARKLSGGCCQVKPT